MNGVNVAKFTTKSPGAQGAPVRRSRAFSARRLDSARLLDERLFRDAIVRERKRADRFEQAFVLVLISLSPAVRPSRWEHLVESLSHTKFDKDVVGWFDHGSIIGLIRTPGDTDPLDTAAAHGDTIRELARGLTANAFDGCSIQIEVYSPKSQAATQVLFGGSGDRRNGRRTVRDMVKRALDIAGSAAFLVAFSPVYALIAALVKMTSKGPVFFRQRRVGHAGRPFTMLKFRTMQVNADPALHRQYVESFIHSKGQSSSVGNTVFKIVNDPRVTRIGHFLRKSSLDEFPQFWNVLKGDMSLVGPRPPLPYEVAQYKQWHKRRVLDAKPGITGLWQVTGRSRTTFDEMVRLDIRYAMNHSFLTDLKILLATPRAVLSGKGAH